MGKYTIISALNKFETTHCAGMFASKKSHAAGAGPVLHNLQQKDDFNVFSKAVHARPVRRKRQKRTDANVYGDIQPQRVQRIRYKGFINPKNRCYFNSVIQCLLYCPLGQANYREYARICTIHCFA